MLIINLFKENSREFGKITLIFVLNSVAFHLSKRTIISYRLTPNAVLKIKRK